MKEGKGVLAVLESALYAPTSLTPPKPNRFVLRVEGSSLKVFTFAYRGFSDLVHLTNLGAGAAALYNMFYTASVFNVPSEVIFDVPEGDLKGIRDEFGYPAGIWDFTGMIEVRDIRRTDLEVPDEIRTRRTIRRYRPDPVDEDVLDGIIEKVVEISDGIGADVRTVVLKGKERERLVNYMRLLYDPVRDLAIMSKIVPSVMRDFFLNFLKEFKKTLGGAPIAIVGLSNTKDKIAWTKSWFVAELIMTEARRIGLDTGSITFQTKSIEETIKRELLNYTGPLGIAFVLNLGYRDEDLPPREIKGHDFSVFRI